MAKVLVVMGSDSDYDIVKSCFGKLDYFGIEYEAAVCSAHRTPERAAEMATNAAANGFSLIIAAAGMAAHLPGVLAAFTCLPVIGIPLVSGPLSGVDALLAEVQMPPGIPVACVAINGADNAAILAAQILALADKQIADKLVQFKLEMKAAVAKKNDSLQIKLKQ